VKRWSCTIEVEASSEDAARLRLLLPEFLHQAGYTTTSGTRTVELSLLAATENLKRRRPQTGTRGRSDWVPVGRRGRGSGPDA